MCTRFAYAPRDDQLSVVEQGFGRRVREELSEFPANHDVRPAQRVPVIRWLTGGQPHVVSARWGFIPPWVVTDQAELEFQTELEHADSEGKWRYAWRYARCLIPATAWYETAPAVGGMFGAAPGDLLPGQVADRTLKVANASGQLFMLAGLHGFLTTEQGHRETTSILTRQAPPGLDWARQRVPCMVPRKAWNEWLYPYATDPRRIAGMLDQADAWLEACVTMQRIGCRDVIN